jgi:prepilin peptidase CpaA
MGRRSKVALTTDFGGLAATIRTDAPGDAANLLCYAMLFVLLGLISRSDIRHRRVSNRLIVFVAILGFVQARLADDPWTLLHLYILGGVLALVGVLWQVRVIGGADVKLLLACLFWVDPFDTALFAVLVATLGALLAIAMLALQRAIALAMQRRVFSRERGRFYLRLIALRNGFIGDHGSVPYAVAIAGALVITLALSAP